MGKRLTALCLTALCLPVEAARLFHEDVYNSLWCEEQNGAYEQTLRDQTRVDCITPDGYTVETDFANKYAEGIGQALHYAAVTGQFPGLLLIVEDWKRDQKYVDRALETLRSVCPPIRLWIITPEDL